MDKRKHHRYPLFATAVITSRDDKYPSPVQTMFAIANISISGLGLYSYTPMDKGSHVSIEVSFISEKGITRKDVIEGRVVWLSKQERLYFMGIAFDEELNRDRQPFLHDYFWKATSK